MNIATALVAAALSAFGATAAAQPAPVSETPDGRLQTHVEVSDLDLASPQGSAALAHRLRAAAERVCGPEPQLMEFRRRRAYRDCVDQAVAEATSSLHVDLASSAPPSNRR